MAGIVDNFFFKKTAQNQPRTPFTELKIRPKSVPEEETKTAPVASPEISEAFHSLKIAQKNLQDLDNSLKQVTLRYQKLIEKMKSKEGYEQKAASLQQKIEELRKIMAQTSTAENIVASLEDSYVVLEQHMKQVSFKPDDRWKITKLLEKYGKEAEAYLQNAINGAQSMAKDIEDVRIVTFPKKSQLEVSVSENLTNLTNLLLKIQNGIQGILTNEM